MLETPNSLTNSQTTGKGQLNDTTLTKPTSVYAKRVPAITWIHGINELTIQQAGGLKCCSQMWNATEYQHTSRSASLGTCFLAQTMRAPCSTCITSIVLPSVVTCSQGDQECITRIPSECYLRATYLFNTQTASRIRARLQLFRIKWLTNHF